VIETLIAVAVVIYGITAVARHAGRSDADKAKPSWAVRAWNASGAPQVEATRMGAATAELAGRAAGAVTRKTKTAVTAKGGALIDKGKATTTEAATALGRKVTDAATRRWQQRAERSPRLWERHLRPVDDVDDPDSPAGATGRTPQAGPGGQMHVVPRTVADLRPGDELGGGHVLTEKVTSPGGEAVRLRSRNAVTGETTETTCAPDAPLGSDLVETVTAFRRAAAGGQVAPYAPTLLAKARAACKQAAQANPDGWAEHITAQAERLPESDPYRAALKDAIAARTEGTRPAAATGSNGDGQSPDDPARPQAVRPTDQSEEGTDMTITTTSAPAAPATPAVDAGTGEAADISAYAPADWAGLAQRVANFDPESDADLINFMTGEVAGICGYAESYETLHAQCVDALGLDPNSVQGLGEFAEHVMELTRAMTAAHQRFVTTYEEVMKAAASGVVLPYNGRWITGEAV
jgi:hypothetical protein